MSTLSAAWQFITPLLDAGISLIPIRDRDDDHGIAKSPFGKSWKPYTREIISKEELWKQMDKYNTVAIGIVCGAVSGNLETIDSDEKYMPGISARLFNDIQTLYPDLWPRLRIHGTPSMGFHLLYRCEIPLTDGNMKLAGRQATAEELAKHPKTKAINFLETRGENGYVAAPPAMGYTVVQDVSIPTITKAERDGLINLCRSYTYIVEPTATPYKPTKADNDYYDTNPFEDFNNRCNPSELMTELGWKKYRHNNNFVWYTRPDKVKGVSMSFNINRRFFFNFTASTELEEHHGYTPANLICALLHSGDKKLTYADLVKRGYGKIKEAKEKSIIRVAATNKKPLPPNISPAASQLHAVISKQLDEAHPYGLFWSDDKKDGIIIDRDALYAVCTGLGFALHNETTLVRITQGIIYEQTERQFFDAIKDYIHEEDADIYKRIINAYEPFIEKHGRFTTTRLAILPPEKILTDTRHHCYKPYLNGVVIISADSIEIKPYAEVVLYVWNKSIQQREYTPVQGGLYHQFLELAIGINDYLLTCMGYLVHDFKDETTGYIVALPEQCENPEDGGGSGKNIFCKLFEHTTTFSSRSGELITYDINFLQSWNGEKIYCISDPPKNFRWQFLKDLSTNDGMIKKLYVDQTIIKSKDMAKFIVPTNYAVEISDGGLKRRIRQIEFTNFFTKAGGIDTHFGVHFPNGWQPADWNGYDHLITKAVQVWLKSGLKIAGADLSTGGWSKQFEQKYGHVTAGFIKEYWPALKDKFVSNEQFKIWKDTYCNENDIHMKYKPSVHRINSALDDWCAHIGYVHNKDARDRMQIGEPRGHTFYGEEAPF